MLAVDTVLAVKILRWPCQPVPSIGQAGDRPSSAGWRSGVGVVPEISTRRCWRHRVRRHLVSRRRLLDWEHDSNAAVVVFGVGSFTAAICSHVADSRPHRSVAAVTSVLVDPQDVVSLSRVCRGPSLAMSQIATPCRRIPIAAGLVADQLDADWRESDADRFKFCKYFWGPETTGNRYRNLTRAISPSLAELFPSPNVGVAAHLHLINSSRGMRARNARPRWRAEERVPECDQTWAAGDREGG